MISKCVRVMVFVFLCVYLVILAFACYYMNVLIYFVIHAHCSVFINFLVVFFCSLVVFVCLLFFFVVVRVRTCFRVVVASSSFIVFSYTYGSKRPIYYWYTVAPKFYNWWIEGRFQCETICRCCCWCLVSV